MPTYSKPNVASSKVVPTKVASSKVVPKSKMVQPFSLNKTKLKKMWKQTHPDTFIANAAKDKAIAINLKNEDALYAVLQMAGNIARYDRSKRTASVEDIDKAYAFHKRGKVAYNKEMSRLEQLRLAVTEPIKS